MNDQLSPLNPMKCVKTYSKAFTSYSKLKLKSENDSTNDLCSNHDGKNEENHQNKSASKNEQKSIKTGPLTTKNAVKMLLEDTLQDKVCRYCLNVGENLSSLEELITIGTRSGIYSIAVKEMIASFYPVRVDTNPSFPSKICPKCLERTINSYLFTQQCDQSDRALRDCFEDILDKVEKLDPLERIKKRGRQKLKPNYNVIKTEHKYVIDYAEPNMHIISTINSSPEEPKIQDLECLKCSQILPDIISLLNHVKTHPKSTWFNCRLCGKSFPKLWHLKKHFRRDHNSKTMQKKVPYFTCNECGVSSSNYQEFLQHIEKHKFKITMEHVLNCNMDKLCAICFEKGSNMVSIHKEVNLHGGFEELTGEKSVRSLISAMLPEKHYKYQELYVAEQANIITLRKKNNSLKSSEFTFTSPLIIYEGNINKYANLFDDYIFMFNIPQRNGKETVYDEPEVKKIKYGNKLMKITEYSEENENSMFNSLKNKCSKENNNDKKTSDVKYIKSDYKFKFSNPIMDVDPNFEDKNQTETLIIHQDTEILKDSNINTLKSDNSCKNFENVDNIENKDVEKEKNDIEKVNTEEIIEKECMSTESIIIKENKPRQMIKYNVNKPWKCTVCLTNNKAERDVCFCCENRSYEDTTKFNFILKSSYDNPETILHTSNENAYSPDKQSEHNVKLEINNSNQIIKENYNVSNEEKTVNCQKCNDNKDIEMETEIIPNNLNHIYKFENKIIFQELNIMNPQNYEIPQKIEAMDIEDDHVNQFDNNIISSIQDMTTANNFMISQNSNENNDKIWSSPLQFNIGTGAGDKGKKYKRPFRNVTRAFHK